MGVTESNYLLKMKKEIKRRSLTKEPLKYILRKKQTLEGQPEIHIKCRKHMEVFV